METVKGVLTFLAQKEVYGLALIIAVGIVFYNFGKVVLEKVIISSKDVFERKKRHTIVKLSLNIFRYVIYILIIILTLNLYGIDTKALLTSIGVAGAVIGLALQDTIKDLINGITMLMDNFFVVGDFVRFGDFTGEVIDMGLKTTKIKKVNGEVLIISNRNINQIINISQKQANIVIDIPTAYEEKIDKIEKTIAKILKEIKNIEEITEEPQYLGISALGDSAVNYTISFLCPQEKQWQIKRQVLKIIKTNYDKDKIKIPYPQIEVHHESKI